MKTSVETSVLTLRKLFGKTPWKLLSAKTTHKSFHRVSTRVSTRVFTQAFAGIPGGVGKGAAGRVPRGVGSQGELLGGSGGESCWGGGLGALGGGTKPCE